MLQVLPHAQQVVVAVMVLVGSVAHRNPNNPRLQEHELGKLGPDVHGLLLHLGDAMRSFRFYRTLSRIHGRSQYSGSWRAWSSNWNTRVSLVWSFSWSENKPESTWDGVASYSWRSQAAWSVK